MPGHGYSRRNASASRIERARRLAPRARPGRGHLRDERLDPLGALAQRRQAQLDRAERAREARVELGPGLVEAREPAHGRRAHAGRRSRFDPGRELALHVRRERARIVEPDADARHARLGTPECGDPGLDLGHRGLGMAGHVRERAVARAAEVVQVADQRAAARARLPAHEHGHVGEVRVETAQQLRKLEIGEPAREARRHHLAPHALRERRTLRARPHRASDVLGARRVGEEVDGELIEQRARRLGVALLADQEPVRAGEPDALAVGELELLLPVPGEPEHHHVGSRSTLEDRVGGSPHHRIRARDEAHQCCARAILAVDDPDGRHVFRRVRAGRIER